MATRAISKYSQPKKKRNKGVHSKNRHSYNKGSKYYKKKYRGQGRKR